MRAEGTICADIAEGDVGRDLVVKQLRADIQNFVEVLKE